MALSQLKVQLYATASLCQFSDRSHSWVQGGFRGLEQGLRRGVRPGEGAVREVAAFLLDHHHFAGVPPTALVSCHASASPASADGKVGSLQVRAHPGNSRLHPCGEAPFWKSGCC